MRKGCERLKLGNNWHGTAGSRTRNISYVLQLYTAHNTAYGTEPYGGTYGAVERYGTPVQCNGTVRYKYTVQ